jgi:PadR family transcriptional regulator PadR
MRMTTPTKLVLNTLTTGQQCGADIARTTGLDRGTTYPILARLVKLGYAKMRIEEGDPRTLGRPLKKFYTLTSSGRAKAAGQ